MTGGSARYAVRPVPRRRLIGRAAAYPDGMSREDYVAAIRALIQHEDTLRDQKLGWLTALNGLLFAGVSFAWDKTDGAALVRVLAVVGALVSASVFFSLWVSEQAIRNLRSLADAWTPDAVPPVVAFRSDDILAAREAHRRGSTRVLRWCYPWRLAPLALTVAWVAIGLISTRLP
jgi:hypothetical protein